MARWLRRTAVAVLALLALTACDLGAGSARSAGPALGPGDLDGLWRLSAAEVGGERVDLPTGYADTTLSLRLAPDDVLQGQAISGCQVSPVSVSLGDDAPVRVAAGGSMRSCPPGRVDALDDRFAQALRSASGLRVVGDELRVTGAGLELSFKRARSRG